MESTITAIEMRRKFGSILDQVVQEGAHITIMRGSKALATLIPAEEHERQCSREGRARTLEEVLGDLEAWKKKHNTQIRKMSQMDTTALIRQMRNAR